jgi:hypothetical protein
MNLRAIMTMGIIAMSNLNAAHVQEIERIAKGYRRGMYAYWEVEDLVSREYDAWKFTYQWSDSYKYLLEYEVDVVRNVTQSILRGESE